MTYFLVSFGFGLCCQLLVIWIARRIGMVAIPNERSMHDSDTPTAGGLGFAIPIMFYLTSLYAEPLAVSYLFWPCLLIVFVSFWDDLKGTPVILRLLCHLTVAILALQLLDFSGDPVVGIFLVTGMVWHINLYNFMDGIDGIAGTQCLLYCLGLLIIGDLAGWVGTCLKVVTGSMLAFLVFNWPKAKIFMGDVGSTFIGFLLIIIALYEWTMDEVPIGTSLILLAVFLFDATYTLIVRLLTRQKVFSPHRSHLYQKLAANKGHLWTLIAFTLFFLFWLLPLAWVAFHYSDRQFFIAAIAMFPLLVVSLKYRAGYELR